MIALLEWVKRLRPSSVPPNPGGEVGSPRARPLGLRLGLLSADQRGATLVTYVLVFPLLILLIFGSFAVWRIMAIRQTLFLGTYKAAWELSQQARELPLDDPNEWWEIADSTIREEVEGRGGKGGNPLIESGYTLNVVVTLPNILACPPVHDSRPITDILFTVEATLSLPAPVRIPFLDPEPITLTERHTSFVKCPRGWDPPEEEHIY
jgi:hypothetical protein